MNLLFQFLLSIIICITYFLCLGVITISAVIVILEIIHGVVYGITNIIKIFKRNEKDN